VKLTLDRFEDGGWAVLELETGQPLDLPARFLPEEAEAGDVIRLEVASGEGLSVLVLSLDRDSGRAQRDEAARRLARLRGKDPGGDLEL
jgi:hypothetical protein